MTYWLIEPTFSEYIIYYSCQDAFYAGKALLVFDKHNKKEEEMNICFLMRMG